MAKKPAKQKKSESQEVKTEKFNELVTRGKKQGYLTFEQISDALPEDMMTPEQIDETLMWFDDLDIEVVEKRKKLSESEKKDEGDSEKLSQTEEIDAIATYGTVADPVKMYLREMGLVTLLSREGEIEIAKRIEDGEQEVLRAMLETMLGVESIIRMGDEILTGATRPKHVLRDIDEGDTIIDESIQIEKFLETISAIKEIEMENRELREKLFSSDNLPADEARRIRRSIRRRNRKIFEHFKDWRMESDVIDGIEKKIQDHIIWYDEANKRLCKCAAVIEAPLVDVRENIGASEKKFTQWVCACTPLKKKEATEVYNELKNL